MSDSLRPHGLQHARPPCPSPAHGVYSNSHPSHQWCHPTISSSVVPFSSCLQSFPASGFFPMSQFFSLGGQSIRVSVNSGSWWWIGRPGVLWFMGWQRVGHDWATELNWSSVCWFWDPLFASHTCCAPGWTPTVQWISSVCLTSDIAHYLSCPSHFIPQLFHVRSKWNSSA